MKPSMKANPSATPRPPVLQPHNTSTQCHTCCFLHAASAACVARHAWSHAQHLLLSPAIEPFPSLPPPPARYFCQHPRTQPPGTKATPELSPRERAYTAAASEPQIKHNSQLRVVFDRHTCCFMRAASAACARAASSCLRLCTAATPKPQIKHYSQLLLVIDSL
jgi:hypothetical protein